MTITRKVNGENKNIFYAKLLPATSNSTLSKDPFYEDFSRILDILLIRIKFLCFHSFDSKFKCVILLFLFQV